METKVCTKCGIEKPVTREYFYIVKHGNNGVKNICKQCDADQKKQQFEERITYAQQHRPEIIERRKERNKQLHQLRTRESKTVHRVKRTPAELLETRVNYYINNKERIKEYNKIRYLNNKESINNQSKCYYFNNKELIKERIKQNPEKYQPIRVRRDQRRRALANQLPSNFTVNQWEECKKHFNGRCAYCEDDRRIEQEHVVPVAKGGSYTRNNIVPACARCNASKGAKNFQAWYHQQSFYSKKRESFIINYLNSEHHGLQLKFDI
jgi:hypothetical protein